MKIKLHATRLSVEFVHQLRGPNTANHRGVAVNSEGRLAKTDPMKHDNNTGSYVVSGEHDRPQITVARNPLLLGPDAAETSILACVPWCVESPATLASGMLSMLMVC